MSPGHVIAIVGAKSVGKTDLAQSLCARLNELTGLRCVWVPEVLRAWCERAGRTPERDEQAGIAQEQTRFITEATLTHDLVIADSTPLMTALYSQRLFDDASLLAPALAAQAGYAATLLAATDLPWVADGIQRDGPVMRTAIDADLRSALLTGGVNWSVVSGSGSARTECAIDALSPWLRRLQSPRAGLFTRLQQRDAAAPVRNWVCETCDVPECEHRQFQERV